MNVDFAGLRADLSAEVHGHVVHQTPGDETVRTWRDWLSKEEANRVATFGAEKRRREYVAGRAAARALLAERLGVTPDAVPLRTADDGGVDCEGHALRVTIAHSGDYAVAACAPHPVGVDLERIQARDPAVARFLLGPGEERLLDELTDDREAALVLCWTLKEAVLKARRTGFRCSPKDVRLEPDPAAQCATAEVASQQWRVLYRRQGAYYLALAVPASET
jgi:4'-phosphopantetheinyl transferase